MPKTILLLFLNSALMIDNGKSPTKPKIEAKIKLFKLNNSPS